jgi:hypothetical protein
MLQLDIHGTEAVMAYGTVGMKLIIRSYNLIYSSYEFVI